MLKLFKTWLILLLMAAVPLQAAAATVARACTPFTPAHASATACQQHHAAPSAAPDGASAPGDAKTSPAKHPACAACAAFCLGALMPPSCALPAAAVNGAAHAASSVAALLPGFIPDGLRRPPRPLSA